MTKVAGNPLHVSVYVFISKLWSQWLIVQKMTVSPDILVFMSKCALIRDEFLII